MHETKGSRGGRCRSGRRRPAGHRQSRRARSTGAPQSHRRLATVVFADVAGSTGLIEELGDGGWRTTLSRFFDVARGCLARAGGTEVVTTGDGLLVRFAAPSVALDFGRALQRAMAGTDLPIRVGVHTAEVEHLGDDIVGLGVHIGARVAGLGAPGEVWVTRTVRDLLAGARHRFEARGTHVLRGVTDPWDLYAVVTDPDGPARQMS